MMFDIIEDFYYSVEGGCKFRGRAAETKLSYSAKKGKEISGGIRSAIRVSELGWRDTEREREGEERLGRRVYPKRLSQVTYRVDLLFMLFWSLMKSLWANNTFDLKELEL